LRNQLHDRDAQERDGGVVGFANEVNESIGNHLKVFGEFDRLLFLHLVPDHHALVVGREAPFDRIGAHAQAHLIHRREWSLRIHGEEKRKRRKRAKKSKKDEQEEGEEMRRRME